MVPTGSYIAHQVTCVCKFEVVLNTQYSSIHIKMHYTPTTTDPTALHNPSLHTTNKHIVSGGKMTQDVGWCESVVVSLIPIGQCCCLCLEQLDEKYHCRVSFSIQRVPVHTFEIAVCCLPGIRLAGTRRSLVADLGKRADPKKRQ